MRRPGQHGGKRLGDSIGIARAHRDAQTASPDFFGQRVPRSQDHRESGPEIIEHPGSERESGFDVIGVHAGSHVSIEQKRGSIVIGHPTLVEENVSSSEFQPVSKGSELTRHAHLRDVAVRVLHAQEYQAERGDGPTEPVDGVHQREWIEPVVHPASPDHDRVRSLDDREGVPYSGPDPDRWLGGKSERDDVDQLPQTGVAVVCGRADPAERGQGSDPEIALALARTQHEVRGQQIGVCGCHLMRDRGRVLRGSHGATRLQILQVGGDVEVDDEWLAGPGDLLVPGCHARSGDHDVSPTGQTAHSFASDGANLHVGVGPGCRGGGRQHHLVVPTEGLGQVPGPDARPWHLLSQGIERQNQYARSAQRPLPRRPEGVGSLLWRDGMPPRPGPNGINQTVAADHRRARHRVLIVTDDVLTEKMAGPAIRAWQIADSLADHHEVLLATTSSLCERTSSRFAVEACDLRRFGELASWLDILVVQGYVLDHVPDLSRTTAVMIVDLYDPLHFETLELTRSQPVADRAANVARSVRVLNEQLLRGDFFVCASDKQRDLWIGALAALGRVNPATYGTDPALRRLIDVVPFGVSDDPPSHTRPVLKGVVPGIGVDDEVVIWGGGVYDWFDPLTLIRAVDKLRARRPGVRLYFMGVRHPNPAVKESAVLGVARRLTDELGLGGTHVFFNDGWVAYADRQNYLLEADIGVSLHLNHAETAYSFRTRILDYLWAGLPIVATGGDGFADIIGREGVGIVVPNDDVDAVAQALFDLLDDPELADACRGRARVLANRYRWSRVLRPLVGFCDDPRRAADDPEWRRLPSGAVAATWRTTLSRRFATAWRLLRQQGPIALAAAVIDRVGLRRR